MNSLDTLLRFLANVAKGEREAAEAALHEDFFVNEVASFPYGGVYKGAKGWWMLATLVNSYWHFHSIELNQAICSGPNDGQTETICLLVHLKGTCRHNNQALDTRVCEIWTVKDGLLLSVEPFFWDTAEMIAMLQSDGADPYDVAEHGGFEEVRFSVSDQLAPRWPMN